MAKSLNNARCDSRTPIIHCEWVDTTFDGLVGLVEVLQTVQEDKTREKLNVFAFFEDIGGTWIYFKKQPKDDRIESNGKR